MTGEDEHGDAARAAAAYRSHLPTPRAPPHISIDVGETMPPARREARAPAPRLIMHGFHAPFRTAFLVALGWTAGRATFRLVAVLLLYGVLGLLLWHALAGG